MKESIKKMQGKRGGGVLNRTGHGRRGMSYKAGRNRKEEEV
jgi:hypothetical protein